MLNFISGAHQGELFPLVEKDAFTIGRELKNDISIQDNLLSKLHCQIEASESGKFILSDLNSSNGTFVNGERVTRKTLSEGDEIEIGGTRLRFEKEDPRKPAGFRVVEQTLKADGISCVVCGCPIERAESDGDPARPMSYCPECWGKISTTKTSSTGKKWVFIVLILASLIGSLGLIRQNRRSEIKVRATRVALGDITKSITTDGTVEVVTPHEVRSAINGRLIEFNVDTGDDVAKGQIIGKTDDLELRSRLANATSELESAKQRLKDIQRGPTPEEIEEINLEIANAEIDYSEAKRNLKTEKVLYDEGITSKVDYEKARSVFQQALSKLDSCRQKKKEMYNRWDEQDLIEAQARITSARKEIENLKSKLAKTLIISPCDGQIYETFVSEGHYLKPGDRIVNIAVRGELRVRAFIDQPDLGNVSVGQRIEITYDANAGVRWQGKVSRILPQLVARDTRTVGEVLCTIDDVAEADDSKSESHTPHSELPTPSLPLGASVDVEIITDEKTNTMMIPRDALKEDGEECYVFVAKDGILEKRYLVTGLANISMIEVKAGLKQSDEVVLGDEDKLQEGIKVKVELEEAK